ncbi:MAG: PIN domain-containing protein [Deinococcales bacterium]
MFFDTNVLFEGLTNKSSSSHLLVKACLAGNLASYVSNALLYEYLEIFERAIRPALAANQASLHLYQAEPLCPQLFQLSL